MKWTEAKSRCGDSVWADLELRPTGKIETKEQYDYVVYYESHIFPPSDLRIAKIPFEHTKGKYLRLGNLFGGSSFYFYLDDEPDGKDMEYDSYGNLIKFISYYEEFSYGKFGKIEFEN